MNYIVRENRKPMSLAADFDAMLNTIFDQPAVASPGRTPIVDVREEKESYILEAELPGLNRNDIEVKVEQNLLTIASAETKNKDDAPENKTKKEGYLVKERRPMKFNRVFVLPKDADPEKIKGAYKNGVLTLEIEKLPEQKPRTIKVNGD